MVASKQLLDRTENNYILKQFWRFREKNPEVLQLFFKTNEAKKYQRLTT